MSPVTRRLLLEPVSTLRSPGIVEVPSEPSNPEAAVPAGQHMRSPGIVEVPSEPCDLEAAIEAGQHIAPQLPVLRRLYLEPAMEDKLLGKVQI